jgi:hypothetical protein
MSKKDRIYMAGGKTTAEAKAAMDEAIKTDFASLEIDPEEIAAKFEGIGQAVEGEITIKFQCKGGTSTKNFNMASTEVTWDMDFGGITKEQAEHMILCPNCFAAAGPVASLAAVLMAEIFRDDGAMEAAMDLHKELFATAQKAARLSDLIEKLELAAYETQGEA